MICTYYSVYECTNEEIYIKKYEKLLPVSENKIYILWVAAASRWKIEMKSLTNLIELV